MWNSWKRKARLASLFETSGCIFCGCIFLDASQPNRQKLLTWNASNFTNTKYHFLKYTLDRSQAPQQVHLRQVPEAAQLKCTEQNRPPWVGLQPLVSEVHAWALCTVHGAVHSAQCTAVDPRESEVDGGGAVQRQSINSSKESFSEVSSFHTNMSRCPAPVKEQNFISMLKVLELFGVSMLAH